MHKWQETEIKQWLEEHQNIRADAMQEFDKTLMEGTGSELSQTQDPLSGRIFDTLIGSPMGKERGRKTLELGPHSHHRWFPWGTLMNHLTDIKAWNVNLTDEEFRGVITETTNHREYFHSYMIKVIDKDKVMIKATLKGGLQAKRKLSFDDKGGLDWKKPDKGGSDKGDGKGRKPGPGGGNIDGKGQMGGWPASGSNPWGTKQADGGAPGAQKEGVEDPGPPPARTATPCMGPPEKWVAGQFTPATYTNLGV
eukprot:12252664-Heterocapsa_arctica.AAC.1